MRLLLCGARARAAAGDAPADLAAMGIGTTRGNCAAQPLGDLAVQGLLTTNEAADGMHRLQKLLRKRINRLPPEDPVARHRIARPREAATASGSAPHASMCWGARCAASGCKVLLF